MQGDIFRMIVQYEVFVSLCWNVYHFQDVGANWTAQMLAQDWHTNIYPTWRAHRPVAVRTTSISVQKISVPADDAYVLAPTSPSGQSGSASLPPQVAAVLQLRTGLAGRHMRGRLFIGGVSGSWHSNAAVSPSGITDLTNYGNAMLARYKHTTGTTGMEWVLRVKSISHYQPIDTIAVNPYLRTMRRRSPGVGI